MSYRKEDFFVTLKIDKLLNNYDGGVYNILKWDKNSCAFDAIFLFLKLHFQNLLENKSDLISIALKKLFQKMNLVEKEIDISKEKEKIFHIFSQYEETNNLKPSESNPMILGKYLDVCRFIEIIIKHYLSFFSIPIRIDLKTSKEITQKSPRISIQSIGPDVRIILKEHILRMK